MVKTENVKKWTPIIVGIVFAFAVLSFSFNPKNMSYLKQNSDFFSHLAGAMVFKREGAKNVYKIELQAKYLGEIIGMTVEKTFRLHRNPPLPTLVLSFLANLQPMTAFRIATLINLALFGISYALLAKAITPPHAIKTWIFAFIPLIAAFFNAHISIFLFLILSLIFVALKREKTEIAGILTGLFLVKPQHLLLIPFLATIPKKRFKFLASSFLSTFCVFGINAFMYGKGFLNNYFKFVVSSENPAQGTALSENFNLISLGNIFPLKLLIALTTILIGITLALLFTKSNEISFSRLFSVAIIFELVLNLHTMASDLVFLVIPIFLLSKNYKKTSYLILLAPILGLFGMQWLATGITLITGFLILKPNGQNN